MKIKEGQKIVFIGDSITDCGRRGEFGPLGNGYVRFFHHLLQAALPGNRVTIINKGIGGNTLIDLQIRWQDDVIYHKPDWVSILVGINDEHRVLRKGENWQDYTADNFRKRYQEVLSLTRKQLPDCGLVCLEPFYVTTDTSHQWRNLVLENLQPYRKVVAEMSESFGTGLIKLQEILQEQLKFFEAEQLAPDGVHPTPLGHMIIAWELFQYFIAS